MPRVREKTSHDVNPQAPPAFGVELLQQGGPEIVVAPAEADIRKLCEDEKFMHDLIQIRFIESADPNATKLVELEANIGGITGKMGPDGEPGKPGRGGQSQKRGFIRGKVYTVERYWWEIAAHAKISTLAQIPNPANPMELMQVNRNTFSYPFECVRDDNPKGRAWREKVWADPA